MTLGAPEVGSAATAALRYWRAATTIAAVHVLGLTWPPPCTPQRPSTIGHWGCNPGVSWCLGHLAAAWSGDPLLAVVGTGHATSAVLAHVALVEGWDGHQVAAASARYGVAGGDPSELLGLGGSPYLGGELGPSLAVTQGLAAADAAPLVACVIGDGECETPAALAAFAHRDVLLGSRRDAAAPWLPIVNANGARMGSEARFSATALATLLRGMGYEVFTSFGADGADDAAANVRQALDAVISGEAAVWISVTDKGWPAPRTWADGGFRGSNAHKLRDLDLALDANRRAVADWVAELAGDSFAADGRRANDVGALAARVSLSVPASRRRRVEPQVTSAPARRVGWASPMAAVDAVLVERHCTVFSPDEASSNGLHRSLAAGLVTEVLAEEVLSGWTWGVVESGREAAFVTYEAFAPLAATQLAQYSKLVSSRPRRPQPPLVVVQSSLGWANSPTHQNGDLAAVALARPSAPIRLVCPVGATSAASRLHDALDRREPGVVVLTCSKQSLLDVPDNHAPVIDVRVGGAAHPEATIIAVGDVCVTESVAAMLAAHRQRFACNVLAVVDVTALHGVLRVDGVPTVGVSWCAPRLVAAPLWESAGRVFPIVGYGERWGATAWETLVANEMDRGSILARIAATAARTDVQFDVEPPRGGRRLPPIPDAELATLTTAAAPVLRGGA